MSTTDSPLICESICKPSLVYLYVMCVCVNIKQQFIKHVIMYITECHHMQVYNYTCTIFESDIQTNTQTTQLSIRQCLLRKPIRVYNCLIRFATNLSPTIVKLENISQPCTSTSTFVESYPYSQK